MCEILNPNIEILNNIKIRMFKAGIVVCGANWIVVSRKSLVVSSWWAAYVKRVRALRTEVMSSRESIVVSREFLALSG